MTAFKWDGWLKSKPRSNTNWSPSHVSSIPPVMGQQWASHQFVAASANISFIPFELQIRKIHSHAKLCLQFSQQFEIILQFSSLVHKKHDCEADKKNDLTLSI